MLLPGKMVLLWGEVLVWPAVARYCFYSTIATEKIVFLIMPGKMVVAVGTYERVPIFSGCLFKPSFWLC